MTNHPKNFGPREIIAARIALEKAGWHYVCAMGQGTEAHRLYFVKVEPLRKFVLDKDSIVSEDFPRQLGMIDN